MHPEQDYTYTAVDNFRCHACTPYVPSNSNTLKALILLPQELCSRIDSNIRTFPARMHLSELEFCIGCGQELTVSHPSSPREQHFTDCFAYHSCMSSCPGVLPDRLGAGPHIHASIAYVQIASIYTSAGENSQYIHSKACHSLLLVARDFNILFQIMVTFLSYISNACHSLSGVAERLQHT